MLASLALLLPTLIPIACARRFEVPLTRRETDFLQRDGTVSLEAVAAEQLRIASKYQAASRTSDGNETTAVPGKRALANLPLNYDGQALWTGPISVGTPPQPFNVYFDLGSTDLSLASSSCTDASCNGKARYDTAASTTAQDGKFTVASTWTSGNSGSGALYRDTVKIGGAIATQQDVVAEKIIGDYVANRAADGVVGLAFRDLSAARSYSFPFTLAQQGALPYFAMILSRVPGKSRIMFNGYDRKYLGSSPNWYPVSKDLDEQFRTLWQIGSSTPYVNNRVAWAGKTNFAFDSGTPLIIAPPDAAAEFWSNVPLSRAESDGMYSFICSRPPKVDLTFGRMTYRKFNVAPQDFNLGPLAADPTRCLGAVVGQNTGLGDTWLIGDAFLKSWMMIFDVSQNRIGISAPRSF
ncbi:hypothetical protein JCM10212_004479 [Sporobolomyces blumeae]